MSAGLVSVAAVVMLACAGLFACWARERNASAYFVALCLGVVASAVLTASSVWMAVDWPTQMEKFDFTEYSRMERGRGYGQVPGLYYLPYSLVVLGALTTYLFARRLHDRIRGFDS